MSEKNKVFLVCFILLILVAFFYRTRIIAFLKKGQYPDGVVVEKRELKTVNPEAEKILEEEMAGTIRYGKKLNDCNCS